MGATTEGGWGAPHQAERRRLAPLVALGRTVCTRYGHPQFPDCAGLIAPGDEWELGHHDQDKGKWTGPEHARCNERAGGLKRAGQLMIMNRPIVDDW